MVRPHSSRPHARAPQAAARAARRTTPRWLTTRPRSCRHHVTTRRINRLVARRTVGQGAGRSRQGTAGAAPTSCRSRPRARPSFRKSSSGAPRPPRGPIDEESRQFGANLCGVGPQPPRPASRRRGPGRIWRWPTSAQRSNSIPTTGGPCTIAASRSPSSGQFAEAFDDLCRVIQLNPEIRQGVLQPRPRCMCRPATSSTRWPITTRPWPPTPSCCPRWSAAAACATCRASWTKRS